MRNEQERNGKNVDVLGWDRLVVRWNMWGLGTGGWGWGDVNNASALKLQRGSEFLHVTGLHRKEQRISYLCVVLGCGGKELKGDEVVLHSDCRSCLLEPRG